MGQELADKGRDGAGALVAFGVVLIAGTLIGLVGRRNVAAFPGKCLAGRHVLLIVVIVVSRRREIFVEEPLSDVDCLLTGLDFLGLCWAQVFLKAIVYNRI